MAGNEISGPISFWELLHKPSKLLAFEEGPCPMALRNRYPRPTNKEDQFFSDVRELLDGGGGVFKFYVLRIYIVKHNYISISSIVGIQLHVSALYVGHRQVVL